MKPNKLLILIFVVIAIIACTSEKSNKIDIKSDDNYRVVIIDSCEYIEYDSGVGQSHVHSLTHKGNCKFCLLRNQNK